MTYKEMMRKHHGTVYPEDLEPPPHYEKTAEQPPVFCGYGTNEPFFPPDDGLTGKQRNEAYRARLKKKRGY